MPDLALRCVLIAWLLCRVNVSEMSLTTLPPEKEDVFCLGCICLSSYRFTVHINNVQLPQTEEVKYLGLHLDRRLTCHKHIFIKRKQISIALTKMYWLLGRKSKLSINNKLLIYKTVLEPIWAYEIQLWGTASTSNIEILERFQSKAPCKITEAPWYVPNTVIRVDLQISTVKHEISRYSYHYSKCLSVHPN
jgi:hypothetical protein